MTLRTRLERLEPSTAAPSIQEISDTALHDRLAVLLRRYRATSDLPADVRDDIDGWLESSRPMPWPGEAERERRIAGFVRADLDRARQEGRP